jgi:hypothetical protein
MQRRHTTRFGILIKLLSKIALKFVCHPKVIPRVIVALVFLGLATLISGKLYQQWDDDPERGAIAMANGHFGESFSTPVYLDQGWDENDSLWFYNTTQGSALVPYDFFLVLELANSTERLRSDRNIDRLRYLPQNASVFNPDGLPVGFVKDNYQDHDYVGYTCAACHTGQINYNGKAIRIDGGPAMADMELFLSDLNAALSAAQSGEKGRRFVANVLALDNDYKTAEDIQADLIKWTRSVELYITTNQSDVPYGYARLDAFGRIYNRVLQHLLNRDQVKRVLRRIRTKAADPSTLSDQRLFTDAQVDRVLEDLPPDAPVINDAQLATVVEKLLSTDPGYPGLSPEHFGVVRDALLNPPNAPVSYPFLWDIAQSDYVQWNGIGRNSGPGALGRNAGEVMGVFGILDWQKDTRFFGLSGWLGKFNISALVTGQTSKKEQIYFKSSIDLHNLRRLESHLGSLTSPQWPEKILGEIDDTKARRGEMLFARKCQSCHASIDRADSNRRVIANLLEVKRAATDPKMAENGISYDGYSGNFIGTYQSVVVGSPYSVYVGERAPAATLLTAATKGVVATPDPDKWFLRRWAEWAYVLIGSIASNDIKKSIKRGNYRPDTTAEPYASLMAYKGRPLNGIWATAPYLHNGSVPTLNDLLLPIEQRPASFKVGLREFDPKHVGFKSDGDQGMEFDTTRPGNANTGHYFGTKLSPDQRMDLVEYMKEL